MATKEEDTTMMTDNTLEESKQEEDNKNAMIDVDILIMVKSA
jgi:hypothetical protein